MKFLHFKKMAAALVAILLVAGTCFAGVKKIDDLKKSKVGVQIGTTSEAYLREFLGNKAATQLKAYEKVADVISALKTGKIDAAVMDESPALFFTAEDDTLKILPEALDGEDYAIAVQKGNKELLESVNKIIAGMKEDGSLAAITAKYLEREDSDPVSIDFNREAKGEKLWVGCGTADFPPYTIRTDEGFIGIDIELCAAIAKKLGRELVIVDCPFSILPTALAEDRVDMICSGLSVTEERKQVMDFSEPYGVDREVIVVLNKK